MPLARRMARSALQRTGGGKAPAADQENRCGDQPMQSAGHGQRNLGRAQGTGPFAEQVACHDAGRGGYRYRQASGERSHSPDGFVVRHEMSELQVERLPCTILLTKDAEILDRFEGYMPPADIYKKLAAGKQMHLQLVEAAGTATIQ